MTEKIIESILDEGKGRIDSQRSPFWSSFIISWFVINWKVIYVTISLNSISIHEKIDYIEKLFPSGSLIEFKHPIYPLFSFH